MRIADVFTHAKHGMDLITALEDSRVGRNRGWWMVIQRLCVGSEIPADMKTLPDILEEDMDLILIILVLFLLFGGGGYWGYRRWR
jgi:hypothetical protein